MELHHQPAGAWQRSVSLISRKALTIDHLSQGRVELGVGVGDRPADCDVFGVPRWPPTERVARLEDQLAVLDRLLRGEPVSREGTYYSVRNATRARVEQLSRNCLELGRDPLRIRRSVLAYRQPVDPLSSLDAFDHFVGSYAELGIGEFVFYWPPLVNVAEGRPISAEQRSTAERIARIWLATPS